MRTRALTAIALVLPLVAAAEGVPVRTAEHDGFTRVVVDFRDRPDWRLLPGPERLTLETGTDLSFDLSDVHRRLGPERVEDVVQPAPGRLDILLNCPCGAEAMELTNEWLVLDIRPDRLVRMTLADGAPRPKGAEIQLRDGLLPGLLTERAGAEAPGAATAPSTALAAPVVDEARPATGQGARETAAASAELRRGLIEAITRSADEGIVRLDGRLPGIEPEAEEAPEEAVAADPPATLPPGSNMLIETQSERDRRGHAMLPSAAACPAGFAGGKADWLAALEAPEPGAPPEVALRADALPLIVNGFGAEAASLLAADVADPDLAILRELARLVDGAAPGPLVAQVAECGPLLSLFALVAAPPLAPRRIEPIIEALVGLDPALAVQLGRRAIAALNGLGQGENAALVRNALLLSVPGATRDDLAPRVFGPGGQIPSEQDALRELAERTPEAAAALRALIDSKRRRGESVPSEIIDQAAAYMRELGEPERTDLSRSVIRAEIAQAGFLSASRRIDDLARRAPGIAGELDRALFDGLIGIESDATFLRQASRFAGEPVPTPEQRVAMASRILELHVPALALGVLQSGAEASRGERLLRARIGIEMSDWAAAEAALSGLGGADVDALAAEIARGTAPVRVAETPPGPSGPGAEGLSVIERSAALREKYRALLTGQD